LRRKAIVGGALGSGRVLQSRAQGEPRPGGYRYYQGGCYLEQPGGWQEVSPCYRGVEVQYAPPARVYDDTPRCMRSPSYNPRPGAFIDRDGYERPCL
jgi:hypothetical protein